MAFSAPQRELAVRALRAAETHTADYYCIPPHQRCRLPYDMLTQADRDWRPLPESALAELLNFELNVPSRALGGQRDFYRILLNDESILQVAVRERIVPTLYAFLTYILTHEMVHLIRLSRILGDCQVEAQQHCAVHRMAEEERVDRISRQILCGTRDRHLGRILERIPCSPGEARAIAS